MAAVVAFFGKGYLKRRNSIYKSRTEDFSFIFADNTFKTAASPHDIG